MASPRKWSSSQRRIVRHSRHPMMETLENRILMSAVTFQIDSGRSVLSLSGDMLPLQQQGPGSLTTTYAGTINADIGGGTIAFTGGSQITAGDSGVWQPSSTSANYGGHVDVGSEASLDADIRDFSLDATSMGGLSFDSAGAFDSTAVAFSTLTGELDVAGSIQGVPVTRTINLGQFVQDEASSGSYSVLGGLATLVLPVQVTYPLPYISSSGGQLSIMGQIVATATLPSLQVLSFTVNDGSAQRSTVASLGVSFNEPVMLGDAGIALCAHDGTPIPFQMSSADGETYVLTFTGSQFLNGSLSDGKYVLTVHAAGVTDSFGQAMATDQSFTFFRLFGDFDGNGTVNNADYFQFNRSFGKKFGMAGFLSLFDFNGDGIINNSDFFQFNKRFGMRV